MKANFRKNGAKGALLDEYEKAILELQNLILPITKEELTAITDKETEDSACKSIQTVLTHVISSGYGYAIIIRKSLGENTAYKEEVLLNSVKEYIDELRNMFQFNVQLFEDYPNLQLEEYNNDNKILVRWGQRYDVEQLIEHAIVHILRHRRQIEKFLLMLKN